MSQGFAGGYQVQSMLYCSPKTQVWLVQTTQENQLCILKCVKKQNSVGRNREASLLQDVSHPKIPKLYDTMEDTGYFYLLEEYFSGESLDHYLNHHKHISQITFLTFAIQICEMIEFLHCYPTNPIIYLDMKPSHIIVCGKQLKLIDFDTAKILPKSGKLIQTYGTKPYAAPEQRKGTFVGKYTDVYAVGKLLQDMANKMSFWERIPFWYILTKATKKNKKRRTQDISILKNQLMKKEKASQRGQNRL